MKWKQSVVANTKSISPAQTPGRGSMPRRPLGKSATGAATPSLGVGDKRPGLQAGTL